MGFLRLRETNSQRFRNDDDDGLVVGLVSATFSQSVKEGETKK